MPTDEKALSSALPRHSCTAEAFPRFPCPQKMPASPVHRQAYVSPHMVVLPAPIRRASAAHPLLRNLLVTDAGYFPNAAGHHVERPEGSATHLMMVCLQGCGWVRGTEKEAIEAGDVVWLSAKQPHSYAASEDLPWTIVWAHFCGEELPHWQHHSLLFRQSPATPRSIFSYGSESGKPASCSIARMPASHTSPMRLASRIPTTLAAAFGARWGVPLSGTAGP